jgi:hypothetical protein
MTVNMMKQVRRELKEEWKRTKNTETMFAIMEIEIQLAKIIDPALRKWFEKE